MKKVCKKLKEKENSNDKLSEISRWKSSLEMVQESKALGIKGLESKHFSPLLHSSSCYYGITPQSSLPMKMDLYTILVSTFLWSYEQQYWTRIDTTTQTQYKQLPYFEWRTRM